MDRRGPLLSLARRLEESSLAKNWRALERANADTSQMVAELHSRGPWNEDERVAFDKLRTAHARARARCAEALSGVSIQIAEIATHREGWLAYAATQALTEESGDTPPAPSAGSQKSKETK